MTETDYPQTKRLILHVGQREIPLIIGVGLDATPVTVESLILYTVLGLDGYTVEELDSIGASTALRLCMVGGTMPIMIGLHETQGIVESLALYTVLDLDPYTVEQLDTLLGGT